MATGRQIQKKGQSNATPTPATGMFKPRPFAIPAESEAATTPELQTKAEPGQIGGSRLSRIDFAAPPLIQPKLTIGAPGDKYEKEADTIADTVMKMPAVSAPTPVTNPTGQTPVAQAKPIAATITPVASSAQMQPEPLGSAIEEEQGSAKKGRIQRRIRVQAVGDGNLDAPSSLETQLNQTKNSGSPLSPQIRAQMEPRFGADFSGVRVHTDAPAVQMNRALGAQAFTHGNHIYYGEGKSPGNDHLTAHELTHTLQQSGSSVIQRFTDPSAGQTGNEKSTQEEFKKKLYELETIFHKESHGYMAWSSISEIQHYHKRESHILKAKAQLSNARTRIIELLKKALSEQDGLIRLHFWYEMQNEIGLIEKNIQELGETKYCNWSQSLSFLKEIKSYVKGEVAVRDKDINGLSSQKFTKEDIQKYAAKSLLKREREQEKQQRAEDFKKRAEDIKKVQKNVLGQDLCSRMQGWGDEVMSQIKKDEPTFFATFYKDEIRGGNYVGSSLYNFKKFYLYNKLDTRKKIGYANLSDPQEIAIAVSELLDVLHLLYDTEARIHEGISLIGDSSKFNGSKRLAEDILAKVRSLISEYQGYYNVLNNTQTTSEEIKYLATKDSLNSVLAGKVASGIESAVPMNGSATFKFNIKIPIGGVFFIGATLEIEAERQEKQFKLRVEATLEGGVSFGLFGFKVELKASVGIYAEAQSDSAYNAMKLISYGLYRKALASPVVPNVLAYAIWSGETRSEERAKSIIRDWENGLKYGIFEKTKDSYVETGDLLKATATAEKNGAEAEASYKYTTGTKHTAIGKAESTSKQVVEFKITAQNLGRIGIKVSIDREESETEISFRTKRFSEPLNAVVAFSEAIVPKIKQLEEDPKLKDAATSLWNINTAAKHLKNASSPAAPTKDDLNSQSVQFSLSFTQDRRQSGFKITKGSLKILRMENTGWDRELSEEQKASAAYGKAGGDKAPPRRSNHPRESQPNKSTNFSLEYETASRLMEFSYANGQWKREFSY